MSICISINYVISNTFTKIQQNPFLLTFLENQFISTYDITQRKPGLNIYSGNRKKDYTEIYILIRILLRHSVKKKVKWGNINPGEPIVENRFNPTGKIIRKIGSVPKV